MERLEEVQLDRLAEVQLDRLAVFRQADHQIEKKKHVSRQVDRLADGQVEKMAYWQKDRWADIGRKADCQIDRLKVSLKGR